MKVKDVVISTILVAALTLPLSGRQNHDNMAKTDMKKHDMLSMMGKPTVDATVEGLHIKAWLMTKKQHEKMMRGKKGRMMLGDEMKGMKHDGMRMKDTSMRMGNDMMGMKHGGMRMKDTSTGMGKDMMDMKHDGMGMDKATKEAMMAGTHHIMLDATDAISGKEIANASANILIVSPTMKHSSVDLRPMMSHFGCGLTLDEKGKYTITVCVNVNGVSKTKEFQYSVK
jgi:hypothetical protein